VLWTSAILAAALLQTPGEAPASGAASASSDWIAAPTQWFATPPDTQVHWGFQNFGPRFGVQHRSQGYGYDSGFTSFETFVPLYQEDLDWLTAFQGNFLIDNYGDVGFNTGLVERHYHEGLDRVLGGNIFFTHRRQGGNDFHQIGFGIETLGSYLDWRANGYLPLGDKFEIPSSGGGVTDATFFRRQLLVNFIADKPLAGFDTEIGGIIPSTLDVFRAYIGVYNFNGNYSRNAFGVQGRLEARLQDMGLLSVAITNDAVFDTNVVFAAGFYLPGTKPRGTPASRAQGRMAEDVIRNHNIVIDRSATTDPVPARWASGTLIDVVHVDSSSVLPSTGGLLTPVTTLTDAQAAAQPGSLIFVRANGTYTGEGIVLQNEQALLGEGVEHTIQSLYGSFVLPTVTPPEDITGVPSIVNAPGHAVTMADNTQVSGFRIVNPGGSGVVGNGLTNVVADRLNISSPGQDAIALTNVSGQVRVTENFITNGAGGGIILSTSAADSQNSFVVSDNTILQNSGVGIDLTTRGQSTNTLVMERNLVRVILGPVDDRALPLVQILSRDSSQLSGRIENNDIEDGFNRNDTSPDEDPYYHQLVVDSINNSRVDIGLINNRLLSDRSFFQGNPRNGSFGVDLNSSDVSQLRARLKDNESALNYAFSELYISRFQLEDTLDTNTGTMLYFPTANFFQTIPAGTLILP
jgi:hypothetical protein